MSGSRLRVARQRLLSLGTGEFVGASMIVLATGLWLAPLVGPSDALALWLAVFPLVLVLVQAGAYWLSARRWLPGRMPRRLASAYRLFRLVDPVLIAAGAVLAFAVARPTSTTAVAAVVALVLFASVEYVNYFVVRLSYPTSRWPFEVGRRRVPRLVHDLRRAER